MNEALKERLIQAVESIDAGAVAKVYGRLVRINGLTLEVTGCRLFIGQRCFIETLNNGSLVAEVVGFNRDISYLMPLQHAVGLFSGARVSPQSGIEKIVVGEQLLGRVVDGLLQPLDGLPAITGESIPLFSLPNNPLSRQPISEPIDVGIRCINAVLTPGKGQRLGLFAGSGVGKSVLLGMMTRYTEADIIIVGLIGERGREVREFIEHSLGEEGLKRAIVVAAPADSTALMRLRAAQVCHRLAEHFRDQGKHVLLLMDSLTRYAQAQREIGLAMGEPPVTKGYPPSVFSLLTQLVERAGNGLGSGSMTAIYTVLVEGDNQQEPIADAARAILDGHIVLSRDLAEQGHYPAIDISASISRVMPQVVTKDYLAHALKLKKLYSSYQQIKELIPLGGYQPGKDIQVDYAVQKFPAIAAFLQQGLDEKSGLSDSMNQLIDLMDNEHAK
ncbi:FliI/YscN family ATPase [Moritella yayanosii]|uniref:Flagellum-specific ATP synthase n=1 Tax=Moritella yayanosii TaxID=69539 RepID=A0A330LP53_9GAMM|nr:FliI/YscN family ATPase [Moritella yayanosii]SQD78660.1 flagellum-specific ATP synthase fliI [Moritella yayanosii]